MTLTRQVLSKVCLIQVGLTSEITWTKTMRSIRIFLKMTRAISLKIELTMKYQETSKTI